MCSYELDECRHDNNAVRLAAFKCYTLLVRHHPTLLDMMLNQLETECNEHIFLRACIQAVLKADSAV